MQELEELKRNMEQQRPVDWDLLPDIPLYMDQVVSYLRRQTFHLNQDGEAPAITSAMVNNYIKDGLLPRAKGKRYGREHLCELTAIALLKNVLSVRDMKLLLEHLNREDGEQAFYEDFCRRVDEGFSACASAIDTGIGEDELASHALDLAIASCAARLACEAMLSIIRSCEPQGDEKKEKKLKSEKAEAD